MEIRCLAPLLLTALVLPIAAVASRPTPDLAAIAVGIVSDGDVIAGGMTLASGPWRTDCRSTQIWSPGR